MLILTCDHAGFDTMQNLMKYFDKNKIKYKYMGPTEYNQDDDYPDFVVPASNEVLKSKTNIGIFMCGSGVGVNCVANRFKGIRAVCCYDTALAFLARKDENANVLCLGARLTSYRNIIKIIKVFLTSKFEGGRHLRRLKKYN